MTESKTDIRGLGIFSDSSKDSAKFQTDNTYYADKNSKQAKQLTAAAMNIFNILLVVVSNLANGVLSDVTKVADNFASAAEKPTGASGKTGQATTPTPFQISLPSPQALFQLPIGKAEDDDEDEVETFKENDDVEVF